MVFHLLSKWLQLLTDSQFRFLLFYFHGLIFNVILSQCNFSFADFEKTCLRFYVLLACGMSATYDHGLSNCRDEYNCGSLVWFQLSLFTWPIEIFVGHYPIGMSTWVITSLYLSYNFLSVGRILSNPITCYLSYFVISSSSQFNFSPVMQIRALITLGQRPFIQFMKPIFM